MRKYVTNTLSEQDSAFGQFKKYTMLRGEYPVDLTSGVCPSVWWKITFSLKSNGTAEEDHSV